MSEVTAVSGESQIESRIESAEGSMDALLAQIDMRCRLQGGGHHLLLSLDRIACPMPGQQNMLRLKEATADIGKWGTTLPSELNKQIQSMITSHIRVSVEYLKKMHASQNNKERDN